MSGEFPEVTELCSGLFVVDYRHCAEVTSEAMLAVRDQITGATSAQSGDVRILVDLRGLHKYVLDAVAFASAKRAFTVKKSAWVADARNLDMIARVFPSTTVGYEIRAFEDFDAARTWLEQ